MHTHLYKQRSSVANEQICFWEQGQSPDTLPQNRAHYAFILGASKKALKGTSLTRVGFPEIRIHLLIDYVFVVKQTQSHQEAKNPVKTNQRFSSGLDKLSSFYIQSDRHGLDAIKATASQAHRAAL